MSRNLMHVNKYETSLKPYQKADSLSLKIVIESKKFQTVYVVLALIVIGFSVYV